MPVSLIQKFLCLVPMVWAPASEYRPFFCPVGRRQEGILHLEVWDLNGSQFAQLDRCLETGNKLHYFFSNHTIKHPFFCMPLLFPDAKSLDLGQFISAFVDKRLPFHVSEACICFLENHAIGYLLT